MSLSTLLDGKAVKFFFSAVRMILNQDHLFADLAEPHRIGGWKTCALIRELESNIENQNSSKYRMLMAKLTKLRRLMSRVQARTVDSESDPQANYLLAKLETELYLTYHQMKRIFNDNFGSAFNSGAKTSMFAFNIQRFADLYTAKLENFLHFPINARFFPDHRTLPHDVTVETSQVVTRPTNTNN
eukprot:gb/GECH01009609.1/.p1 GENE.gb/GECH01009609.1/~~gb/GECH01009609.1/.p1  ORF type:complete len:186 (+),score=37.28 gb/GECH01009609.1/:1-558(+)